jgi:hypothetical protein
MTRTNAIVALIIDAIKKSICCPYPEIEIFDTTVTKIPPPASIKIHIIAMNAKIKKLAKQ